MEENAQNQDWSLENSDDLVILTQNDEHFGTVNHVAGHQMELGEMLVSGF